MYIGIYLFIIFMYFGLYGGEGGGGGGGRGLRSKIIIINLMIWILELYMLLFINVLYIIYEWYFDLYWIEK